MSDVNHYNTAPTTKDFDLWWTNQRLSVELLPRRIECMRVKVHSIQYVSMGIQIRLYACFDFDHTLTKISRVRCLYY